MEPVAFGSYSWLAPFDVVLASLGVRVDELAARLRVPVDAWDLDGVGPVRGFGCRLSSGHVFWLSEFQSQIQWSESKGPYLFEDAADLGAQGLEPLLTA